jgi:hypothetical protein
MKISFMDFASWSAVLLCKNSCADGGKVVAVFTLLLSSCCLRETGSLTKGKC